MRLMRSAMGTAAALALALSALPAWGIDEPPRPPMSALGKIRDLAATVRARRVLQDDPTLSSLNLGLQVENGVVSVWGPIPSREVERQVTLKLETLKGITKVQLNFYVQDRRDRGLDLVRPDGVPERIEAAKPEIETGKLPVTPATPVGRRDSTANEGPRLFAPRPTTAPRTEAAGEVGKLPRPATSLTEEVRQARQSERRFRDIVVQVQDRTVVVRRGKSPGDDVMDLVQKLRRVPGVREVILAD